MDHKQFLEEVEKQAKATVNFRVSMFRERLTKALSELTGYSTRYGMDGTDHWKPMLDAFLEISGLERWPQSLYDREEKEIIKKLFIMIDVQEAGGK